MRMDIDARTPARRAADLQRILQAGPSQLTIATALPFVLVGAAIVVVLVLQVAWARDDIRSYRAHVRSLDRCNSQDTEGKQ